MDRPPPLCHGPDAGARSRLVVEGFSQRVEIVEYPLPDLIDEEGATEAWRLGQNACANFVIV